MFFDYTKIGFIELFGPDKSVFQNKLKFVVSSKEKQLPETLNKISEYLWNFYCQEAKKFPWSKVKMSKEDFVTEVSNSLKNSKEPLFKDETSFRFDAEYLAKKWSYDVDVLDICQDKDLLVILKNYSSCQLSIEKFYNNNFVV